MNKAVVAIVFIILVFALAMSVNENKQCMEKARTIKNNNIALRKEFAKLNDTLTFIINRVRKEVVKKVVKKSAASLKITWYATKWEKGYSLYSPVVRLKVKNISGRDITESKELKIVFFIKSKKEEWSTETEDVHYFHDPPFKKDYSKTLIISSKKGFGRDVENLPYLAANIYEEYEEKNKSGYSETKFALLKTINIRRSYFTKD